MGITVTPFGWADGREIILYTWTNGNGMELSVTNWGGRIVSLKVPGRGGQADDVVLGFDSLGEYVDPNPHLGGIVGRYANRIANGRFTLGAKTYQLPCNQPPHHLHGGDRGFDSRVWDAGVVEEDGLEKLSLTLCSPDGDEGYPGKADIQVCYALSEENEVIIQYTATAEADTVMNLTNHSYFNLAGHGAGTVHDHIIQVSASRYTPTDDAGIPTGALEPVAGTPMDLTKPVPIGKRINDTHPQIAGKQGFDINYALDTPGLEAAACTVKEPGSGRIMEVFTTKPGVQFYTSNFILEPMAGKDGAVYRQYGGFCLETQFFPDSPNHPAFPSALLRAGDVYHHQTLYRFSLED